VSHDPQRFTDTRNIQSIGSSIGVPTSYDVHPPGYDQPSNVNAFTGAVSPAKPSPREWRAFASPLADVHGLDRSASMIETPFGEKTPPPTPRRRVLATPLADVDALDHSAPIIGTRFGEKTLPPPPGRRVLTSPLGTPSCEKTPLPMTPKRRPLASPLASAHLDRSVSIIGTSFGEKTLPPPPYQA
jgi:hypothetical protein